MNDDHAEAVLAYAKHYGGVSNPAAARMVSVKSKTMELEVDGASLSIAFDHTLVSIWEGLQRATINNELHLRS